MNMNKHIKVTEIKTNWLYLLLAAISNLESYIICRNWDNIQIKHSKFERWQKISETLQYFLPNPSKNIKFLIYVIIGFCNSTLHYYFIFFPKTNHKFKKNMTFSRVVDTNKENDLRFSWYRKDIMFANFLAMK